MRGTDRDKGKRYRDSFVSAQLSTGIAAQIQTMREDREWLQKDLAAKAEMSPARISVMENPSYENLNVKTLKRLASAFDVALVIRFIPFSELVRWVASVSPEKLSAASFDGDSIADPISTDLAQTQSEGRLGGSVLDVAHQQGAEIDIQNSATAHAMGAAKPDPFGQSRAQRKRDLPPIDRLAA